jgi:hypothetical protein
MLNSLGWILILLLLLKIVFFKILNHLLTSRAKLTVKLYHRHIFNDKVISTTLSIFFRWIIVTLISDLKLLFGFRVALKLFLKYISYYSIHRHAILASGSTTTPSNILVGTKNEIMLIYHS